MIALLATAALAATWVVGVDAGTVQEAVDLARDGDVVEVPPGVWRGPVVVDRSITLTGEGVLDGGGVGTVVRLDAPGAVLDGLRVQSSGRDLATSDACVWVSPRAAGAVVRGNHLTDCAFGIWLHEVRGVRVVHNDVRGVPGIHPSTKGNGIHLFDSEHLVVQGNTVTESRDGIYVSATEHSLIADNTISGVRYGIHYMYSYDNTVTGNVTTGCTGGIALMESRGLTVTGNVSTDNERRGILFRDIQYCTIEDNQVLRNGEGLFFFSSLDNTVRNNLIAHNQVGARVWAGSHRNVVAGNTFAGNGQQVLYVSATDQVWGDDEGGNYWSDYLGWDQDGDGLGDRPYRADSFLANLLYRYPGAVHLMNSPALELIGHLQAGMPALRTASIIDEHPLVSPVAGE